MNPEYKNLRDLPGAPAGTVGDYDEQAESYCFGGVAILACDIHNYPDWFAPEKDETLEEAVAKLLASYPTWPNDTEMKNRIYCPNFWEQFENLRAAYERELGKLKTPEDRMEREKSK